jgi:methylenetetrahydrofolate dehydrogenase (NADP+) / methenyltetrahydrofolate cyclohydrolase
MIIDGNMVSKEIQKEVKEEVDSLTGRKPCLAFYLVGKNPASLIYVNNKIKACKEVGISTLKIEMSDTISEKELLDSIKELNERKDVDGILVQLPLPSHIDVIRVTLAINPNKDVDGFHPTNMGKLYLGQTDGFVPCTPLGIKTLLERYKIEVSGKHVVMVGRSNIVGKPMAALLMQSAKGGNATVTIAHSYTKNLKEICLLGDIIIVAIGKSNFLKADMVKEGAVVIDVGISRIEDPTRPKGYRLTGDIDYPALEKKCSFITPVPGGVGPMTIALLLQNTVKAYRKNQSG